MQQLFRNALFRKYAKKAYYTYINWEQAHIAHLLSPQGIVLAGVFKGLRYPAFTSSGSGLVTKLLGSYEDELHPFIQKLSSNRYTEIIDIGCAEGYYAVGLARMFKDAKVFAYDIDTVALNRCRKMAETNGVNERVVLKEQCTRTDLLNFNITGRGFILCDCEGYEFELFDEAVALALKNCDLIIELHEHLAPGLTAKIESAFKGTHKIEYVTSRLKHINDYPLVFNLPFPYQQDIYLIDRDRRMQWACITAFN